tara:strand:- start:8 stop:505 length:498 start_codon:yes stop_codon:yes gene_type:complete
MIDSTVSGANSNSYVTLTEADSYFEGNPFFGSTWISKGDAEKEYWLQSSTRSLDRMYVYSGERTEEIQSLEFPRDIGEASYPNDVISKRVKDAQLELIVLMNKELGETGNYTDQDQEEIEVLNGLAKIKYAKKKDSRVIQRAFGGSTSTVKSLVRPWLGSKRVIR